MKAQREQNKRAPHLVFDETNPKTRHCFIFHTTHQHMDTGGVYHVLGPAAGGNDAQQPTRGMQQASIQAQFRQFLSEYMEDHVFTYRFVPLHSTRCVTLKPTIALQSVAQ
jgi:hypothetical protein